jgi:hypothetical protein
MAPRFSSRRLRNWVIKSAGSSRRWFWAARSSGKTSMLFVIYIEDHLISKSLSKLLKSHEILRRWHIHSNCFQSTANERIDDIHCKICTNYTLSSCFSHPIMFYSEYSLVNMVMDIDNRERV